MVTALTALPLHAKTCAAAVSLRGDKAGARPRSARSLSPPSPRRAVLPFIHIAADAHGTPNEARGKPCGCLFLNRSQTTATYVSSRAVTFLSKITEFHRKNHPSTSRRPQPHHSLLSFYHSTKAAQGVRSENGAGPPGKEAPSAPARRVPSRPVPPPHGERPPPGPRRQSRVGQFRALT